MYDDGDGIVVCTEVHVLESDHHLLGRVPAAVSWTLV